jgi:hypothetical protein
LDGWHRSVLVGVQRGVADSKHAIPKEVIAMRIAQKILLVVAPVLVGGAVMTATVAATTAPTPTPAVGTPAPETEPADTEAAGAAEAPEAVSANEPAGGGHSDEAPGATVESTVDYQFEGNQ